MQKPHFLICTANTPAAFARAARWADDILPDGPARGRRLPLLLSMLPERLRTPPIPSLSPHPTSKSSPLTLEVLHSRAARSVKNGMVTSVKTTKSSLSSCSSPLMQTLGTDLCSLSMSRAPEAATLSSSTLLWTTSGMVSTLDSFACLASLL